MSPSVRFGVLLGNSSRSYTPGSLDLSLPGLLKGIWGAYICLSRRKIGSCQETPSWFSGVVGRSV